MVGTEPSHPDTASVSHCYKIFDIFIDDTMTLIRVMIMPVDRILVVRASKGPYLSLQLIVVRDTDYAAGGRLCQYG